MPPIRKPSHFLSLNSVLETDYWTVPVAAKMLGISHTTLNSYIYGGRVTVHLIRNGYGWENKFTKVIPNGRLVDCTNILLAKMRELPRLPFES